MQDEKDRGKVTAFSTLVLAAKRVFEVAKQFNKKQIAFISIFGVDFDLSD
jgi:hypothetical protein